MILNHGPLEPADGGTTFDINANGALYTNSVDLADPQNIGTTHYTFQSEREGDGTYESTTTWVAQESLDDIHFYDTNDPLNTLSGAGIITSEIPLSRYLRFSRSTKNTVACKAALTLMLWKGHE